MVIIDTNIFIDHLRTGDSKYLQTLLSKNHISDLYLSVLTIQELYTGQSTKNLKNELILQKLISPFSIVYYDEQVAKLAGEIARDSKKVITFVDSAIAASAILNNATLVTLNTKDFKKIKGLQLYNW